MITFCIYELISVLTLWLWCGDRKFNGVIILGKELLYDCGLNVVVILGHDMNKRINCGVKVRLFVHFHYAFYSSIYI